MGWGLLVHAEHVAKEGMPTLLDEVANVGKASTTGDINILGSTQHQQWASRISARTPNEGCISSN